MTLDSPHFRNIPTREVLLGLARLHPFVLLAGRDGSVSWMNDRLREQLEGSAQASLPESDQLSSLWDDARRGAVSAGLPLDIRASNGTQACVHANAFDLAAGDAGDSSCVIIARPRTDRAPRGELNATVPLLTQVLESAPDGIVVADRSGYISYANARAAAFLGRSREELVGRPVALFIARSPNFAALVEKLQDRSGLDGVVLEVEREGGSLWLSASTRPLLRGGTLAGVITYLTDITQRHLVEEELKHKNHELESYVENVAHDLRSPLVSLLGFTRLLKEDYREALDDSGFHFLDRVEQAGRTMDALIHDLLELSRIREPGELRPLLDPRAVLQQISSELKLRLEERGVELELPSSPPMMRVDRTRLYQMFSNLIGNALEHGFAEHRAVQPNARVRVEIREDADAHVIVVSDNGHGVPAEDQARIFEIFQTGSGVRRGENSHGVGLAIVKKIATSHGGRVWVESEPERGARFHVRFPRT